MNNMKKFNILADGLAFQYEVEAKSKKEAFKIVNSLLKGELEKIKECGGEVSVYE